MITTEELIVALIILLVPSILASLVGYYRLWFGLTVLSLIISFFCCMVAAEVAFGGAWTDEPLTSEDFQIARLFISAGARVWILSLGFFLAVYFCREKPNA